MLREINIILARWTRRPVVRPIYPRERTITRREKKKNYFGDVISQSGLCKSETKQKYIVDAFCVGPRSADSFNECDNDRSRRESETRVRCMCQCVMRCVSVCTKRGGIYLAYNVWLDSELTRSRSWRLSNRILAICTPNIPTLTRARSARINVHCWSND